MNHALLTIPNLITLGRLACLPVLWGFAFQHKPVWVGVGTLILLLTDILDGQLARRLHQVTALGAKLDSLADNLLIPSALIWLLMLRPEILQSRNLIAFVVAVVTNLLLLAITYFRFRRYPPNLHLYSAKASGVFGAIFILHSLVFGLHPVMLYLAAGLFTFSNTEGILLVLTRSAVHEHMGSIFRRPRPSGQS